VEKKDIRILIVDDELSLRSIFAMWFARMGYQTMTAENGQQALELVLANPIDVVVSDVRMPVMDGITMAKRIHAMGALSATGTYLPHILFISGFSDLTSRDAAAIGVEVILAKPTRRGILVAAVERVLQSRAERWQNLSAFAPRLEVSQRYTSITAALAERQIAFGRGGICLHACTAAGEDEPVGLMLHFDEEASRLEGKGIVRWKEPVCKKIGIEIETIALDCLPWVLAQFQAHEICSYIPADV
jgi:CheY-like chemotaxis protein